jgi:hypothetical protein
MTSTINASTSSGIVQTADLSGSLALQANGTTGLNLSSAGVSTTPVNPAFEAGIGSTSDATLNTGSNIPFNVVNYQRGSSYNNSTYAFTAPVTGYYLFTVGLFFSNSASSTGSMQAGFVKNGSFISTAGGDAQGCISCTPNSLGGTIQLATSLVISLSSGDTVAVQPRGASIRVYQGHCYFSGSLIG